MNCACKCCSSLAEKVFVIKSRIFALPYRSSQRVHVCDDCDVHRGTSDVTGQGLRSRDAPEPLLMALQTGSPVSETARDVCQQTARVQPAVLKASSSSGRCSCDFYAVTNKLSAWEPCSILKLHHTAVRRTFHLNSAPACDESAIWIPAFIAWRMRRHAGQGVLQPGRQHTCSSRQPHCRLVLVRSRWVAQHLQVPQPKYPASSSRGSTP
jgi:hypothetical protein